VDAATVRAWLGRRLGPPALLLGWFYLAIVAWLLIWTAVPWAALGWQPRVVEVAVGPDVQPGDVVLVDPSSSDALGTGMVVVTAGGTLDRIRGQVAPGRWSTLGGGEIAGADVGGVGRLLVPAVASPVVWWRQGHGEYLALLLVVTATAAWITAGRGAGARLRRRAVHARPAWTGGRP